MKIFLCRNSSLGCVSVVERMHVECIFAHSPPFNTCSQWTRLPKCVWTKERKNERKWRRHFHLWNFLALNSIWVGKLITTIYLRKVEKFFFSFFISFFVQFDTFGTRRCGSFVLVSLHIPKPNDTRWNSCFWSEKNSNQKRLSSLRPPSAKLISAAWRHTKIARNNEKI